MLLDHGDRQGVGRGCGSGDDGRTITSFLSQKKPCRGLVCLAVCLRVRAFVLCALANFTIGGNGSCSRVLRRSGRSSPTPTASIATSVCRASSVAVRRVRRVRRRRLRLERFGVPVEWEEEPFEWTRPSRFGVVRRYVSGPVATMRVLVELTPSTRGGCTLVYQVWAQPRNALGLLAIPAEIGVLSADASTERFDATTGSRRLLARRSPPPPHVRFAPGGRERLANLATARRRGRRRRSRGQADQDDRRGRRLRDVAVPPVRARGRLGRVPAERARALSEGDARRAARISLEAALPAVPRVGRRADDACRCDVRGRTARAATSISPRTSNGRWS